MSTREATDAGGTRHEARTRILEAAYDLFSRHGIRAVGVDRIIAESDVAKKTLYRHFRSKQDLVLVFLELRQQRWTQDWLRAEMERRGSTPRERVLAVFDVFDEWFHRPDYEGCSFHNTLLEFREPTDPLHRAAASQLDTVRAMLEDNARQAEDANPARTANQLQILLLGAIASAGRGDRNAARDARALAELLLEAGSDGI